jgi:hypothetical protein
MENFAKAYKSVLLSQIMIVANEHMGSVIIVLNSIKKSIEPTRSRNK